MVGYLVTRSLRLPAHARVNAAPDRQERSSLALRRGFLVEVSAMPRFQGMHGVAGILVVLCALLACKKRGAEETAPAPSATTPAVLTPSVAPPKSEASP